MNGEWLGRILLAGALALLAVRLHPMLGLAPFFLVAFLLWFSVREGRSGRTSLFVLLVLLVGWILHQVRWVVYPLLFAVLLALWLDPLVDRMERARIPRMAGAFLALLPIGFVLAVAILVLVPMLIEQLQEIAESVPYAIAQLQALIASIAARLNIPPGEAGLPPWLEQVTSNLEALVKTAVGGATEVGRGVTKVIQWLGMAILLPVFAYYLLVDWDRIRGGLVSLVPPRFRSAAVRVDNDVRDVLPRYMRGQFLIAMIEFVLYTIGFLLAALPHALALGFLAGLFSLLPVIGFWVTIIVVLLSALLAPDPVGTLIVVAIVLAVMQALEGQVIVPRVQGKGLGLHPLAVMLAVFCFALLFGIAGALLAVPALGVLKASLPGMRECYERSSWFIGEGSTNDPSR